MRSARWISVLAVSAAAAALAAGCGSSDGGDTSTATASTQSDGGARVDEAKQIVAQYSKAMDSVNLPPLSKQPPRDVRFVYAECSTPACHIIGEGATAAGKALGWNVKVVSYDPVPDEIVRGFQQVVDLKPDVVGTSSVDATAYEEQMNALRAADVPVAVNNNTDEVGNGVIANVTNPEQIERSGRLVAAWVVAEEGDKANVAMFNIPDFPILVRYEAAFKQEYERLCPDCKYTSKAVTAADIGNALPGIVTSTIERTPGVNVAVMGFGDLTAGVPAALDTAGFGDVKITGISPSLPNLEALLNGEEDMWVAVPLRTIGWKTVDALARSVTGDPVDVATTADTPLQILTQDNAPDPAAQPEVVDYETQFKELWHVNK